MKRFLLWYLIISLTLSTALSVWYALHGERWLRETLLNMLRPVVGQTLNFEQISLNPRGATLKRFSLDLTPRVSLEIAEVNTRVSYYQLLRGGIKFTRALDELKLTRPRVLINLSQQDTSSAWAYKSYPLKPFSNLTFLRQLRIQDASIEAVGEELKVLGDSISGTVNFKNLSEVKLRMMGRMIRLPDVNLRVEALADLIEGSFQLKAMADIKDVSRLALPDMFADVGINSGSLDVLMEITGTDSLSVGGDVSVAGLNVNYGDNLYLEHGTVNGNILYPMVKLNGGFDFNGIYIPFSGTVSDPFALEWDLRIQPDKIDLKQLESEKLGIPPVSGKVNLNLTAKGKGSVWQGDMSLNSSLIKSNGIRIDKVNLNASAKGKGADWGGNLSFNSDSISVNGMRTDKIELRASADKDIVTLKRFNLKPLGADLSISGSHNLSKMSTQLNWKLKRQWSALQSDSWSKIERPYLESQGSFSGISGFWDGKGTIVLSDGKGEELLNGEIRIIGKQCNVLITSAEQEGQIKLSFGFNEGRFTYRLDEYNFHVPLRRVLKDNYIPQFLTDYSIDLGLKGDLSDTDFDLTWQSDSSSRRGQLKGKLRRTDDIWNWAASIRLHLSDVQSINGVMKGNYHDDQLNIEQAKLQDQQGRLVLESQSTIQFSASSITGKLFPINNLSIELDRLPVARLLSFVVPDMVADFKMLFSGKIETKNDTLTWKGEFFLLYPDAVGIVSSTRGFYAENRVTLEHLSFVESTTQQELLDVEGSLDLENKNIDSLIVVASELPLDRILKIVSSPLSEEYNGLINGRIKMFGDLKYPEVTADIHLTSGKVRDEKRYWANLNVTTVDSFYWVNQINFGKGVAGLLDLSGLVHRYNYTYDIGVLGRNVNVQTVMKTLTGKPGPLFGSGNFDISLERSLDHQLATAHLVIEPGTIGPVPFDKLTGIVRMTGLHDKMPRVMIDSVIVDWGATTGHLSGIIPLIAEEEIDISGSVGGEIMTLLHRINPYFNSARGSGHLLFQVGGDFQHPILESGQFQINNGKVEIKDVGDKFDRINVKIDIDQSGTIKIGMFEAHIEGNSFNITNRFPGINDNAKPLKFADYNLGVVQMSTSSGGVWMIIPGLMKNSWGGFVRIKGHGGTGVFELQGPVESPIGIGEIQLRSAIFTYPLLPMGGGGSAGSYQSLFNFIKSIRWNVRVIPTRGCRYVLEMSQLGNTPFRELTNALPFVDVRLTMDLRIDDNPDGLLFSGSVKDTLHLDGELISSSGDINFLDMQFQVDQMSILFNPSDIYPLLEGGAYTTVQDSSSITGEREIRIQLRAGGSKNGDESISKRAGFEDMTFVLEDDKGSSQEEILRLMGYSPDLLLPKLGNIGKSFVQDALPLREWSRMLEQKAKKLLGIDRLQIESSVTKNLIEWQLANSQSRDSTSSSFSYLGTLDQSRVTVGKYLTRDLYLSYTGILQSALNEDVSRLGMVHDWNLQYRLSKISPNLRLNYQYMYDSLYKSDNMRYSLRYSFYFNLARRIYPKWLLK